MTLEPETPAPGGALEAPAPGWKPGFNEYILGALLALTLVAVVMGVALYLRPSDYTQLPELQPVARVSRATEFLPGASRIVSWGTRVVLVVHALDGEYYAVQGTAPTDGCILDWDAVSQRIVSPCNYLVYDLHGNVVRGLTTIPLRRYAAFERAGVVYISERLR